MEWGYLFLLISSGCFTIVTIIKVCQGDNWLGLVKQKNDELIQHQSARIHPVCQEIIPFAIEIHDATPFSGTNGIPLIVLDSGTMVSNL